MLDPRHTLRQAERTERIHGEIIWSARPPRIQPTSRRGAVIRRGV
jgi:hypothetical protein